MSDTETDPERLDSWKAIAAYLGRTKTTLERWERHEGLPIRRLPHGKRGSVFAYKRELDAWRSAREQLLAASTPAQRPAEPPRAALLYLVPLAIASAVLVIVALAAVGRRPSARPDVRDPAPVLRPVPLSNDLEGQFNPGLSPDGTLAVFDRQIDGRRMLMVKNILTRAVRPLELDGDAGFLDAHHPSWSPRGDLIAFLVTDSPQTYGLMLVAATGGAVRRLTTMTGIGVCWHPSGTSIGFADREGRSQPFAIHSISIATGVRVKLTTPPASAFGDTHCAFSPDGRELAIERHEIRSASDLFVQDLRDDAAGVRRLTSGRLGMDGVAWSPDGRILVFGSPHGLWQVPVTAGEPSTPTLVTGAEGTVRAPSISGLGADGSFSLVYQYQLYDVNIWRWDQAVGDSRVTRLAGSSVWESFPALSPDGRRVAYVSNRTGATELWVAEGDGSNASQVTNALGTLVSPQWSPDGRRLVFSSYSQGNWDLHLIDANGSNLRRLTSEPSQDENPAWSHDGWSIYFRSDRAGIGQIWRMAESGGPAVRVTEGPASQAFESPDGRLLYFVRRDDAPGLWSVPVAGGRETLVTNDVHQDQWAITNAGIAFLARAPHGPTIQLRSFHSGTVTSLASLPAGGYLWGFSATPDAQSALWMRVDHSQNDIMILEKWRR